MWSTTIEQKHFAIAECRLFRFSDQIDAENIAARWAVERREAGTLSCFLGSMLRVRLAFSLVDLAASGESVGIFLHSVRMNGRAAQSQARYMTVV